MKARQDRGVIKALTVFGTRPEAIKMAPVIEALKASARFDVRVALTGQHKEMLDQALDQFNIQPDVNLELMKHGQTPADVVAGALQGLEPLLNEDRPDVVLVHGDTVTTFAGALAAFFHKIPVAHVEAGLRTSDRYDPFPEEMDRRLTGVLANLHFAPTARAKANLLQENVDPDSIYVTGNSVVDALLQTAQGEHVFQDPLVAKAVASGRKLLLVTTHRRENWGEPLRQVYRGLLDVVAAHPDIEIVLACHLNPVVRDAAMEMLGGKERITIVDPPPYREFVHLLKASTMLLTDSGGLQEEAPTLGVPVLVLRETTERPEGIQAGACLRVGTDADAIVSEANRLLTDPSAYAKMARAVNPYGDGRASERIRDGLLHAFGMGPRPADFGL